MKSRTLPGGALEERVLHALWDLGAASIRDVHGRVGGPDGLAYTTIATVLDRLASKGLATRRRRGQSLVYRAAVTRERVARAQLNDVLGRVLGPEPTPAMASLVDAVEALDPDLLDELGRLIEQRRRSRDGS